MIQLTDVQIVRLFKLCAEITAVRNELPQAPQGFDVGAEAARALRVSLGQHSRALYELRDILSKNFCI